MLWEKYDKKELDETFEWTWAGIDWWYNPDVLKQKQFQDTFKWIQDKNKQMEDILRESWEEIPDPDTADYDTLYDELDLDKKAIDKKRKMEDMIKRLKNWWNSSDMDISEMIWKPQEISPELRKELELDE